MSTVTAVRAMNPAARREALATMAHQTLDVLVVGGGVVGAGVALDAVSRGLSTGLVEMRDWACGTSSRSSKLVHGGLRYLEMLDFGLVREALTERGLLLERLAPHLVRPVSFLYPLKHRAWERAYVGAGVALYDVMSTTRRNGRGLPLHRHLSRRGSIRLAPSLRDDSLTGALLYWDAQVDDARHTFSLVRTAADMGAHVANRAKVVNFLRADDDRIVGAEVEDTITGERIQIRAKHVIVATGVWTDEAQGLLGRKQVNVKASKGIHIVVPRDRIESDTGIILRTEKSVLFIIPWGRHWVIGTTDNEWVYDKAEPAATATEIAYLLERVNAVVRRPLTTDDIEGVFAGLRPLLAKDLDASGDTAKLSREHIVMSPVPGVTIVTGGKYTTYRVMAEDAVDIAVQDIARPVGASRTEDLPLVGGTGYEQMWEQRGLLAQQHRLPASVIEHLLQRYGTLATDVLALTEDDLNLREFLPGSNDYLAAEALYAVTHEGAMSLDDILDRRTRLSFESWDRGVAAARYVATLIAPHLGWDEAETRRQVDAYVARVEAALQSERQVTDEAANSILQAALA